MHIKFLARGTGSARAAADYLLGTRDATGQPRAGVEILRGDPHRVAAVADALAFEHKYTSGVIAWAAAPALKEVMCASRLPRTCWDPARELRCDDVACVVVCDTIRRSVRIFFYARWQMSV